MITKRETTAKVVSMVSTPGKVAEATPHIRVLKGKPLRRKITERKTIAEVVNKAH